MAANNDGNFSSNDDVKGDWQASWETEDNYWTENFSSRPYAIGPDFYERFRPAYRYGFESAQHHSGRKWEDAEEHLKEGWDRYENRGDNRSTWDEIRDAVRDAWDRVTGNGPGTSSRTSDGVNDHVTMRARRDEPLA